MRNQRFIKAVVCSVLVVLALSSVQGAVARSSSDLRGRYGLNGDWDVKTKFGEREMNSILAFSRDKEDKLTAQWISFWGIGELKDLKFEKGKLSFTQTYKFGDNALLLRILVTVYFFKQHFVSSKKGNGSRYCQKYFLVLDRR